MCGNWTGQLAADGWHCFRHWSGWKGLLVVHGYYAREGEEIRDGRKGSARDQSKTVIRREPNDRLGNWRHDLGAVGETIGAR
jgi:hypothetical protein